MSGCQPRGSAAAAGAARAPNRATVAAMRRTAREANVPGT
jgi:hypothetical protein